MWSERFRGFCRISRFYPNCLVSQPLPVVLNSLLYRKVKTLGQQAATPLRSPPVAQSPLHGRGPVPSWPPLTMQPGTGQTLPPTDSHSHGARCTPAVCTDTRGPPGGQGGGARKGALPVLHSASRERAGEIRQTVLKKKTEKTRNTKQKETASGEGQTAVQTQKPEER